MTRNTYIATGVFLIVFGIFLLNYLGIFNWFDQNNGAVVDPEQVAAGFVPSEATEAAWLDEAEVSPDVDEQDDTEALPDADNKNPGSNKTSESTVQSYPGTTFEHSVQVKHEGVVIKDKGPREGVDIQKRSLDDILQND